MPSGNVRSEKLGIIIPTHEARFPMALQFVASYFEFGSDLIRLHFITGAIHESRLLWQHLVNATIAPLKLIRSIVTTTALPTLLARDHLIPERGRVCLMKIQHYRYGYQSVKKLYAGRFLGLQRWMVLDDESMLVRNTSIARLFDQHFQSGNTPFTFWTSPPNGTEFTAHRSRLFKTTENFLDAALEPHATQLLVHWPSIHLVL